MTYLDTSVLVSLYCPDANSAVAAQLASRARDEMVLTSLGELETVDTLQLRVFRREITKRQAASSLSNFEADLRDGIFVFRSLPENIFLRARALNEPACLRESRHAYSRSTARGTGPRAWNREVLEF